MSFYYVYILRSESNAKKFYTGITDDVKRRLKEHNSGKNPSSAPYIPWKIKTCIAFEDKEKAIAFEDYLKTASGRAFAKKRL